MVDDEGGRDASPPVGFLPVMRYAFVTEICGGGATYEPFRHGIQDRVFEYKYELLITERATSRKRRRKSRRACMRETEGLLILR